MANKMAKGGSVKGRAHFYAAGGMVQDQLSKVTGHPSNSSGRAMQERRLPQSVQAMTALPGETPAERSKRLRSGG
jgi:hypothetical protein|tara:strand:- start:57 stop:281 length:225 start_codon:yes stop_codon:yes gene_type:complete